MRWSLRQGVIGSVVVAALATGPGVAMDRARIVSASEGFQVLVTYGTGLRRGR